MSGARRTTSAPSAMVRPAAPCERESSAKTSSPPDIETSSLTQRMPLIIGVDEWGDSSVNLVCRLKIVPPIQQWTMRREFLKRLKKAYDARGIEIPFPHLTVYAGELKDGSAPPFRVSGLLPTQ